MATRMLIDARHPEETRVAVLNGNRIEEFDFESAEHKQIKGNIYLAKVTRVEPSLQAAFVDFGGNRHGFLAFSEIHPDYYQIPAADRAALIAEELAAAEEEAALRAEEEDYEDRYSGEDGDDDGVEEIDTSEKDEVSTIEDGRVDNDQDGDEAEDDRSDDGSEDDGSEDDGSDDDGSDDDRSDDNGDEDDSAEDSAGNGDQPAADDGAGHNRRGRGRRQGRSGGQRGQQGGSRAKELDDLRARRQALRRRYKIQDVIQRRQVLLVQVVKEERGNKGAALTSYLSLAGRYCVLMPNSSHGGGISRKIANGSDRKRLKQIVGELSLPQSMGLIVRTAGLQRTKPEIKRDFDYLARLWDEIRETTLASSAPALIHSDSDLIKRAIRDIYNREIEEVVVEGPDGYKAARDFMKLLMPSHVRRVKQYADPVPLFQRYGAEDQLLAMYDPVVQLRSGGYLVINPTEALVSIDINSGRSTKEHGIEQTALNTNLEAAREIARQLRLRDMAGLVVIDFIDMEHNSSIRKVEKAMKDALRNDRARIQVGRISGFGLMEMSRQRLRTGVLEATSRGCPHCDGTGLVRTASSAGLAALRLIEEEAAKGKGSVITLFASTEAAIYLLNAKRADLGEIEMRYHVAVEVMPEGEDEGAKMRIESSGPRPLEAPSFAPIVELEEEEDDDFPLEEDEDEDEVEAETEQVEAPARRRPAEAERTAEDDDGGKKKRRRRRRGGRNRNRNRDEEGGENEAEDSAEDSEESGADEAVETAEAVQDAPSGDEAKPPRGRRRRSGRQRESAGKASDIAAEQAAEMGYDDAPAVADDGAPPSAAEAESVEEPAAPKRKRRASRAKADPQAAEPPVEVDGEAKEAPRPRSRRRKASEAEPAEAAAATPAEASPVATEDAKPAAPRRRRKAAEPAMAEADAQAQSDAPASTMADSAPAAATSAETSSAPSSSADNDTEAAGADSDGDQPRRGGWWQRTFGA